MANLLAEATKVFKFAFLLANGLLENILVPILETDLDVGPLIFTAFLMPGTGLEGFIATDFDLAGEDLTGDSFLEIDSLTDGLTFLAGASNFLGEFLD